ncbi:hypothetical protein V2J09_019010 [Rumex salicifolius]
MPNVTDIIDGESNKLTPDHVITIYIREGSLSLTGYKISIPSKNPRRNHRPIRSTLQFPHTLVLFPSLTGSKMQGAIGSFLLHGRSIKIAVMQHLRVAGPLMRPALFQRFESTVTTRMEEHGFESTTIADILKGKGKGADGSWLWCTVDDSVYDAVKSMTQHNVGALVVVKPGEQKSIAGIITERDYLRKIIVQGRSSKSTKVGDIMTEENKLITVSPTTKVLKAMQLMTDNRIRHIPVINDKGMIGMVSIGDVVRAVVSEHREELDRLNAFIQGGY